MDGDDEIRELDERERTRWRALGSVVHGLGERISDGKATGDDVIATFTQLQHIPIDTDRVLNAMHVPESAGVFRDALVSILRRIPDGWGRWISCDPGWYSLVTELDAELAALCPEYKIHQAKEKNGTLRFYAQPCEEHGSFAEKFHALIRSAETKSATVCESCGAHGKLSVRHHHYRTLCEGCVELEAADGRGRYEPVKPRL